MWVGRGRSYGRVMAITVVAARSEDMMDIQSRSDRWLTALALPLVPFLLLLLPALLLDPTAQYSTAREQAEALAGQPFPYWSLGVQAAGGVLLLPAALGVLALVRRRRRGVVLGSVGAALGVSGAIALLLLLGIELAMGFLVEDGSPAAVDASLAIGEWTVFGALLVVGLAAPFLALPVLAWALWRSRVVPVVVPLLFLVPLALGFVPLPDAVANVLPTVAMLVPAVWMGARLVRLPATAPADVRPGTTDARPQQLVA